MNRFINLSNHPSSSWTEKQKVAAENELRKSVFAEEVNIEDFQFPEIDPHGDESYVFRTVLDTYNKLGIRNSDNVIIHVMGEMTFVASFVQYCAKEGIICVASTTERIATEINGVKSSRFIFCKFRRYSAF